MPPRSASDVGAEPSSHDRRPRSTLPCASAMSCTSMWRDRPDSAPINLRVGERARAPRSCPEKRRLHLRGSRATRKPRPPPRPTLSPQSDTRSRRPRRARPRLMRRAIGAWHDRYAGAAAMRRASILSPIAAMASAGGPTKMMPASAQARRNRHSRRESHSPDGWRRPRSRRERR